MATPDELYSKFGVTAEAAQLFETALGTLALYIEGLDNGWHVTTDGQAASVALGTVDRSTLGRLLSVLKKRIEISAEISQTFDTALAARNLLSHGFFERHNFAIQTDTGRGNMLADLEELHKALFKARQVADSMTGLVANIFRDIQREHMAADAYANLYTVPTRLLHMKKYSLAVRSLLKGISFEDTVDNVGLRAALERCLENISEASRYVPMEWKQEADVGIDWQKLIDLGDELREPPYSPEPAILWRLCTTDLDPLEAAVDAMIAAHGPIPRPPPRSP